MPEKVRLIDDPILRKVCEPADLTNDPIFIAGLLEAMNETMLAEGGIGLAANQIGYSLRIFILKDGETSYKEYINPELSDVSELVPFQGEACLSIPGASSITNRYRRVCLSWLDKKGVNNQEVFEDMKAFAIQHEMDHLNGKLYVDQLSRLKREIVLNKHRKFIKRH